MIEFSFLDKTYQTERIIGDVAGRRWGPTLVFFGGIHGNEPSGVVALQQVFNELERFQIELTGRMIGLAGNLPALAQNRRFASSDLNRIWDHQFTQSRQQPVSKSDEEAAERIQQHELFEIFEPLLELDSSLYFIDLHTTSAPSVPFIAINDQLDNRRFALEFPVPIVLGIEEYLAGPLLSYLNEFGRIAMAFEAGQHLDPESVRLHVAFIYMALVAAGAVSSSQVSDWNEHRTRLENCGRNHAGIYEVIHRHGVKTENGFRMNPGYRNFMPIRQHENVAHDSDGAVQAPHGGKMFMPLYQDSGDDGFFIVRSVPRWALRLSSVLRRFNFDRVLPLLPGVSRSPMQDETLVVNKKVARFLATELFHLLGYRRKKDDGTQLIFSRREIRR